MDQLFDRFKVTTGSLDKVLKMYPYLDEVLRMNPHVECVYFIPSTTNTAFDKETGLCPERTVEHYEIALFPEDGGYCVIDDEKYDIHKGDIRFLRPGQKLYSKKFGDFFSLHFTLSEIPENKDIDNGFFREIPTFMPSYNLKSYINLFKELILAGSGNTVEDMLILKYKMNKMLCNLYNTSQSFKKSADMSDKSRTIIEKAINFMENNLSENIGLDEISAHVNLHPVYFNRIFSKSIGTPPIGYLKKLRLNKAKALLLTTNLKVVKIAQRCGFATSSYFIVQFRKEFGCTPSEYRAINNEDIYSLSM